MKRNGGKLEGDRLQVKVQAPKAAEMELWDDYGSPVERIASTDSRWNWKGNWSVRKDAPGRTSAVKGAEAAIAFDGTGVIITGAYLASGGKADIYLDGKLDRTVDVYPDESNIKTGESVWHTFGLKNAHHEVRLVVRGETYTGSTGSDVNIDDLIVFR